MTSFSKSFSCTKDADETIQWINEKDALISSDDSAKDLASVQALQRKHEGVERDLAALEVKKIYKSSFFVVHIKCHFKYIV